MKKCHCMAKLVTPNDQFFSPSNRLQNKLSKRCNTVSVAQRNVSVV